MSLQNSYNRFVDSEEYKILYNSRVCCTEVLREGSFPPMFMPIDGKETLKKKLFLAKSCHGCECYFGQEFNCEMNVVPGCSGGFEVSDAGLNRERGMQNITARYECECLRESLNVVEKPFRIVVTTKYESGKEAAYALGQYLLYKLVILPIHIIEVDTNAKYQLTYHSTLGGLEVFHVSVFPGNGGFFLDLSSMWWLKNNEAVCIMCNFQNQDAAVSHYDLPKVEQRVFFLLPCEHHYVCEECVLRYFSYRDRNTRRNNGDHAPVLEYKTEPYQCMDVFCPSRVDGKKLPVPSVQAFAPGMWLAAPYPICFFGAKPVYTKDMVFCCGKLYRELIAPWIPYFESVPENSIMAEEELEEVTQRIDDLYEAAANGYAFTFTSADMKELSAVKQDLASDVLVYKKLCEYLNDKRSMLGFVLEWNEPYPKEFLDVDYVYYQKLLDRRILISSLMKLKKRRLPIGPLLC